MSSLPTETILVGCTYHHQDYSPSSWCIAENSISKLKDFFKQDLFIECCSVQKQNVHPKWMFEIV